ncbi:MAG: hydrogenase accessory protein [Pseudomonadota bacterium]
MNHPLITRLNDELGWPLLADEEALTAFTERPGWHAVFVPGDPARNLESADVAIILPELRMAFQRKFDCAIAGNEIETRLREDTGVLKTPSIIFFRSGAFQVGIPKVRDWDEYMARITHILAQPCEAAE